MITQRRAPGTRAPELATRPSVATALRNVLALTKRSLLKIKSDPEELLGFTIQPVVFVLLFVYVFGVAIAGSTEQYLQYLLPGITVQSVMFATMGTGLGLNEDMNSGIFDRFRSLPIARWAPLAAQVLGDLVRYALFAVVLLTVGLGLGFRIETGVFAGVVALALLLIFAFAACWMSCLVGLLAKTAQGVQTYALTLMFPLTFASTVFVPVDKMPNWLAVWVRINPVSHLTNALRGLLLGGMVAAPVLWTLVWTGGILAVFAPLSLWAYHRRV